jgi:EXLDI family protein
MTEEFKEIRLEAGTISGTMGEDDNLKIVKFRGRELANFRSYHGETGSSDDRGITNTLYKTEKGKYLLYTSNWSNWQGESSRKSYEIYDSLEEMEGEVPDGLLYKAKEESGQDPAEELNI